jgi:phosphoribosylanthranilate isomerase
MRVKVKICGITSAADALAAADAGADALGFMFYPPSPRAVALEQAAAIIRELPPFVAKVGVFVNASESDVRRAIEISGIDTLQFHGEETPDFCRLFRLKVIKAFRVQNAASLESAPLYHSETWLLDSYVAGQPGGTGARFDWEFAVAVVKKGGRILLAGGLTPENVAEAVRQVRPFGLDVSSGVEKAPGVKDAAKVRAFIEAARTGSES